MARLYADENVPWPVVVELRRLGHDVVTAKEAGLAGRGVPDDEVLAFASTERRLVLTLDRQDFIRLHRARPTHEGIVVCTFDPNFERQAQRIHAALGSVGSLAGRLIRVSRPE